MLNLAKKIIKGYRITKNDDLNMFLNCDLNEICEGANLIRKNLTGSSADLCSIISAKNGRCPENCKFCSQSVYSKTNCKVFDFLNEEEILRVCKENEKNGIHRFSIVTAGHHLNNSDFEKAIRTIKLIKATCNIKICASMGFLSKEQLHMLHLAGLNRYHCNLETSKNYFKNICTTHSYEMKTHMLKQVKAEGLSVCSGMIIGMGETAIDRLNVALDLAEIGVDSIPINLLIAIKGTPLENCEKLNEADVLRTIAFFKYINPNAQIRLAAGRAFLTNYGELAFKSGASAMISGNMLTTKMKTTVFEDKKMLIKLGFKM